MASPSQNPSPDERPEDPISYESPAPSLAQMRAALEHGRERLVQSFQTGAQTKGWAVLDTHEETLWRERWQEALRESGLRDVENHPPGELDSLQFRILAVAKDGDAFYSLVCFEDIAKGVAVVVGVNDELVTLTYGAHAARLVAVPHDCSPEVIQAEDEESNEESPLFEMLFLDSQSFSLESRKFGAGETSGLVGDIFLASLSNSSSDVTPADEHWEISPGFSRKESQGFFAFECAGSSYGHCVFEIELDSQSNFVNYSLSTPVSSKGGSAHRLTPRTPRELVALEDVLGGLRYREVESLPVPGGPLPSEVFQNGVRALFKDWAPGFSWRVHHEACYAKPNDPDGVLLLHAYALDSAGRYLLPFMKGGAVVTSEDPIGLLVEARREQLSEVSVRLRFRPRMIHLPPELSLETLLAQSLADLPNSLLGMYALSALQPHLDHRSIHWLSGTTHGHLLSSSSPELASDSNAPSAESSVGLLCFHSLGAHKLLVHALPGGVVDLATGIQPQHLFPELPPFA